MAVLEWLMLLNLWILDPWTADSCDAITGCLNDPIAGCGTRGADDFEQGSAGAAGLLVLTAGALLVSVRLDEAE